MSLSVLGIAALFFPKAYSQAAYQYQDTQYEGCATVDLQCFSEPIVPMDGPVSQYACEMACAGSDYAALFPSCCRCGNDTIAIVPTDDSRCDYPCLGNPNLGMCGSNCPGTPPNLANVVIVHQQPVEKDDDSQPSSVDTIPSSLDLPTFVKPSQSQPMPAPMTTHSSSSMDLAPEYIPTVTSTLKSVGIETLTSSIGMKSPVGGYSMSMFEPMAPTPLNPVRVPASGETRLMPPMMLSFAVIMGVLLLEDGI